MAKGQFSAAQSVWLTQQLPEYIKKLDAGVRGGELTKWKQAIATKALGSPEFEDLDFTVNPRTKWFGMIVRKYTNYLHQIYLKEHPEVPGRQLFARDLHSDIVAASKERSANKGTNEAAAYQIALKSMWDVLDADEKADWEAKAEDECGDIALNQREFDGNILLALRGLCQGGLFGDAEMLLFYAFQNPDNGDLQAGTQVLPYVSNFGGDELATTYGVPWSEFAEAVIPRPHTHQATAITLKDGIVIFPAIDLDIIPLGNLRFLLSQYFQLCWKHRDITIDNLIIPWAEIVSNPAKFYDTEAFIFPLLLKNPEEFTMVLCQAAPPIPFVDSGYSGLLSGTPVIPGFRAGIVMSLAGIQSSPPTPAPGAATSIARAISVGFPSSLPRTY
ncbi:hypothetical protein C8F04DRAFT_1281647 [Mycena alexandri]|uniref:Uncharacterized protein n=1 Tax=Mycena alexandri TaxID=1745969 RepID=A0AAD6RWP7_9AGAR|nr:hypothetical protein C8F04DRAFT_1281647 [Mycena alexandri]